MYIHINLEEHYGEKVIEPFYKTNYIDSLTLKTMHIPTLRRVVAREKFIGFDEWEK